MPSPEIQPVLLLGPCGMHAGRSTLAGASEFFSILLSERWVEEGSPQVWREVEMQ
jgi:hypothetical protein